MNDGLSLIRVEFYTTTNELHKYMFLIQPNENQNISCTHAFFYFSVWSGKKSECDFKSRPDLY